MGSEKSGFPSRAQPHRPLAPIRAFHFPSHLFSFLSPSLALVQHLCNLGDLVQEEVISALPVTLLWSHLSQGVLACLWPEGAVLPFQSLPSTREEGGPDCLLGSGGEDEK